MSAVKCLFRLRYRSLYTKLWFDRILYRNGARLNKQNRLIWKISRSKPVCCLIFSTINREGSSPDLNSPCNADCGCSTALYDPVCADGIQYFSPCYAGCTDSPVVNYDGEKVCGFA